MTGKITPTTLQDVNGISAYEISQSSQRKEQERVSKTNSTNANVSDSVELSGTAKLLSAVQQEIAMEQENENNGIFTEERSAKIAMLKEQIESGNYKIDSHIIAKNIINEENF